MNVHEKHQIVKCKQTISRSICLLQTRKFKKFLNIKVCFTYILSPWSSPASMEAPRSVADSLKRVATCMGTEESTNTGLHHVHHSEHKITALSTHEALGIRSKPCISTWTLPDYPLLISNKNGDSKRRWKPHPLNRRNFATIGWPSHCWKINTMHPPPPFLHSTTEKAKQKSRKKRVHKSRDSFFTKRISTFPSMDRK